MMSWTGKQDEGREDGKAKTLLHPSPVQKEILHLHCLYIYIHAHAHVYAARTPPHSSLATATATAATTLSLFTGAPMV